MRGLLTSLYQKGFSFYYVFIMELTLLIRFITYLLMSDHISRHSLKNASVFILRNGIKGSDLCDMTGTDNQKIVSLLEGRVAEFRLELCQSTERAETYEALSG